MTIRKFFLLIVLCLGLHNIGFSYFNYEIQVPSESEQLNRFSINETKRDTAWNIYPFTLNLSVGSWIPVGTLSEYFNPCVLVGFGFGFMLTEKMRMEYTVIPRFMNSKKQFDINVNNTVEKTNSSSGGSVIGGWLIYKVYADKNILLELTSGISWEALSTNIEDPDDKDETLDVSAIGFSIGMNSLINKFGKQNIGLSVWYNYAAYNNDKLLKSNIGGHSISISLIYRLPSRRVVHHMYRRK